MKKLLAEHSKRNETFPKDSKELKNKNRRPKP